MSGPLTLLNTIGGLPGTLALTGGNDEVAFFNTAATLDNATVFVSGSERFNNDTLTLGHGVSLSVAGGDSPMSAPSWSITDRSRWAAAPI